MGLKSYNSFMPLEKILVEHIYREGLIIDASQGGLIKGASHLQGGIYILQIRNGEVGVIGNMEGGEYVVNAFASEKYPKRLEEINSFRKPGNIINPDIIANDVRTIVVPRDCFLLFSSASQVIINKEATSEYLKEINSINESCIHSYTDSTHLQ